MLYYYILASILGLSGFFLALWQFFYNKKRNKKEDEAKPLEKISSEIKELEAAIGKRFDDFQDDINTLSERLTKLETSSEIGWKMLELYAGKLLHHPDTPNIDFYIDKMTEGKDLTYKEALKFAKEIAILLEDSSISIEKKTGGTLLLAALARRYGITWKNFS